MKIVENSTMIYIYTPYNPDFISKLKGTIKCRWDATLRCWVMQKDMIDTVRNIMTEVYGYNDLDENQTRYSVKCRAKCLISETRGPIVLFGKTIVSACGRDSGAQIEDDVEFTEGKPSSGGSVKNWTTVICEGSEFIIHGVVKAKLEEDSDLVDILSCVEEGDAPTISEQENIRMGLERKRIALIGEVEEIDSELAKLEQNSRHHGDPDLLDKDYFELQKRKAGECIKQVQNEEFKKYVARMDDRLKKDLKKYYEDSKIENLFVRYMGIKELAGVYANRNKDDLWNKRHEMYWNQLEELGRELGYAGYNYYEAAGVFCNFRGSLKVEECIVLNVCNEVIEKAKAYLKSEENAGSNGEKTNEKMS